MKKILRAACALSALSVVVLTHPDHGLADPPPEVSGGVGPGGHVAVPRAPGRAPHQSVLVHLQPGMNRNRLRAFAAGQGAFIKYEYRILPNVVNVRGISPQGAAGLAHVPGVVRVEDDAEVHAHMDDSVPLVRALQSQISVAGYSADGSGVRICIIDTGLDSDHSLFADRIDFAAGRDFVNGDNDPEDDNKHGTHVAGIAAGGTGRTVDANGCGERPFQGMAPAATVIGVKVLDANGSGAFSDLIAGIDYCADQSPTGGRADVINMSLGGGTSQTACDLHTAAAASNAAVDAGVVVIASAGNGAQTNALGVPACASKVISVGATYDNDYPNCQHPDRTSFSFCTAALFGSCTARCDDDFPLQDQRTCFSNASDMLDVVAPGCITLSADFANSPDGLIGFCGTSMSAPHVSGLAALLLSANPYLTPAKVRDAIRGGAVDVGDPGYDPTYGFGRIDALNSLALTGPDCEVDTDCDDTDGCTLDVCVNGFCSFPPIDCDDGDGCTADACTNGVCSNTPVDCNDGDPCTTDTCSPETGCVNVPRTCDDGNACTTDFCAGGVCWHNTVFCNDGDPCSTEHCDPAVGCVIDSPDCNDNDLCTADVCDPSTGCSNTPIDCDDGNACTADGCLDGVCSNDTIDCDDANLCTTDSCDPAIGCLNTPLDCDDADACTTDACANGVCSNEPKTCDDGNPCTRDVCDSATGCASTPIDCDDGNACTTDFCAGGICWHTTVFCDDVDPCSTEHCDPAVGCVVDTPGCDDGDPCTLDVCDETNGCTNTPLDCDDADPCTTDSCLNGTCVNDPVDCDDANPCTVDSCDPAAGCVNTLLNCDDGDPCTDDSCVSGSCSNVAVSCDDGDACTTDICDPVNGCTHAPLNCDDGNACTTDFCAGGVCWHNSVICDDGDVCTVNSCDQATGCRFDSPTDCDDGDPCTIDGCDPATGCLHDLVICPPDETCIDGVCQGTCNDNGVCDSGEDCQNCPGDCFSTESVAGCGNGVCEPFAGEDCLSCPGDCNGRQNGRPANQFCCGDGDGVGAVDCTDSRCQSDGFQCSDTLPESTCCGDSACTGPETTCNCAVDCGTPPGTELFCADGLDDDCDGAVDCADSDCAAAPECNCLPVDAACSSDSECCSGKCRGSSSSKTCR